MVRMALPEASTIWLDGALVPWHEARTHVLTHGLHYGTGVLEGTRVFGTADGPAVFRLPEHLRRLERSAHMLRMQLPYSADDLTKATAELVRANGHRSCYLRHFAFLGYGSMGIDMRHSPVTVSIAGWEWQGQLPGSDAGITLKTSSWRRNDPNSVPPAAKATGPYLNSVLARREANDAGYDEALLLGPDGSVSECTGENVFAVRDGVLRTPCGQCGRAGGHHPGHRADAGPRSRPAGPGGEPAALGPVRGGRAVRLRDGGRGGRGPLAGRPRARRPRPVRSPTGCGRRTWPLSRAPTRATGAG